MSKGRGRRNLKRVTSGSLPALYGGYSARSASAQRDYLRSQRWLLWMLIGASVVAAIGKFASLSFDAKLGSRVEQSSALCGLVLFVVGLVLTQRQQQQSKPESWYDARAMAESIKSIAWKFMMGADPYRGPNAEEVFRADLLRLLTDGQQRTDPVGSEAEQITNDMRTVRAMSTAERVALYRSARIQDQRQWYTQRSQAHETSNRRWRGTVTAALVIGAAANAIALLVRPLSAISGVASAVVPCVIAWNQTQRHRDLAHQYAFTSHEIGVVAAERDPATDDEVARFVADCETAFSREHTMWRARRENAQNH